MGVYEIHRLRERIAACERNIEAQKRRMAGLDGNEAARWLAQDLLAGTETILRGYKARLEELERDEQGRGKSR